MQPDRRWDLFSDPAALARAGTPEKTAATDLIRKTVVSPNRQRELLGRTVRDGAPLVLFDQGDPSEWTADHFAKILPATADDESEILEAVAE